MESLASAPTETERRYLRNLQNAGLLWYAGIFGVIGGALLMRYWKPYGDWAAMTYVLLWFSSGLVIITKYLKCPRCSHHLWKIQLASEYGRVNKKDTPCPGCGLQLAAWLDDGPPDK